MIEESINVKMKTANKPINPPMMQRKADSIKNSASIVPRFAPIAFFKPIWLVRSLTVTNMIFATPNIPTINDRPAIAHPPILRPDVNESKALFAKARSVNEKLSSAVGLSFLNGAH